MRILLFVAYISDFSTFFSHMLFLFQLHCWNLILFTSVTFHSGLIVQGHLIPAIEFIYRHNDCFFDVLLLSTVSKLSLRF